MQAMCPRGPVAGRHGGPYVTIRLRSRLPRGERAGTRGAHTMSVIDGLLLDG